MRLLFILSLQFIHDDTVETTTGSHFFENVLCVQWRLIVQGGGDGVVQSGGVLADVQGGHIRGLCSGTRGTVKFVISGVREHCGGIPDSCWGTR